MKRTVKLRSSLLMVALVAIAPVIGALFYSALVVQRDEIARARENLEALSRLVAANQEQLIGSIRQILVTVASGPSIRRNDLHDLCVEFLRNVQAASPSYTNIGLLDLQGNIECQALGDRANVNAGNRLYFRNAIRTGAFSVGEYMVGRQSNRKSLGFGMPAYDYSGVLRGVVFAALDLEDAHQRLTSIALPGNVLIHITDARGNLLVSNNDTDTIGAPIDDATLLGVLLRHQDASVASTDHNGMTRLHALKVIGGGGGTSLMVSVSMAHADAIAVATSHFKQQMSILLLASLLGVLLAWALARKVLAQPVAQLLARMQRSDSSALHAVTSADAQRPANAEFAALDAGISSMVTRLQDNEQRLQRAQEISRVGFFELDLKTGMYTGSDVLYDILGLDPAKGAVTTPQFRAMVHPDDLAMVIAQRDIAIHGGSLTRFQYRVLRNDGTLRWIDSFGKLECNDDGQPRQYCGALQDITERKLSEQSARASEHRFRLLFENSLDGVLQGTPDGAILSANSAACAIFGMSQSQLCKGGRAALILPTDPRLPAFLDTRSTIGKARSALTMVRADGSLFEAEISSSVYHDLDGNLMCSMVLRDVTQRIRAEHDIHRLAFFDALTDLPNRRLLIERLSAATTAAQAQQRFGAVLFADLDHFKNVNDARGHAVGDALLQLVAQRLSGLLRAGDTAARIGGDEFVILLPDLAEQRAGAQQQALAVAEHVRAALAEPFAIHGQMYASGGSIGVTLLPNASLSPEELLREADTAMYRAKTSGRNRIAMFESSMLSEVEQRFAFEADLAQALDADQLEMVLQPQFDHTRRAVGCELLMRWTHPLRGPVSPAEFIPVAEASGLIVRLGTWALREGCRTVLRLRQAGCGLPVSVNVSPRQFRQPDFVTAVREVLIETGAPADQLIFEVTEGLLIDNLDDTILRMHELSAMGIRFSIDDFGTGYSSLGYLRRLPLYELKIDRSFIQDIPVDTGHTAIVQSILSMAGHLGLRVVAEGVETLAQQQFLERAGCECMQGYLLARPMPVAQWLALQQSP